MATTEVEIYLNDQELTAELHFEYTPPVKGKLTGPPEDCYAAVPEEWEYNNLFLMDEDGSYTVDISELIPYIDFGAYDL